MLTMMPIKGTVSPPERCDLRFRNNITIMYFDRHHVLGSTFKLF